MSIVLLGGVESANSYYKRLAKKFGISLKIFTGHERDVGSRLGNPDAIIIITKLISHAAKNEVMSRTKNLPIPIIFQQQTSPKTIAQSFEQLVNNQECM